MSVRQHRACLAAALLVIVASVALDLHPLLGWQNYDVVQYLHIAGFALLAFAAGNGLAARSMVDGWEAWAEGADENARLVDLHCELVAHAGNCRVIIDDALAVAERGDLLGALDELHHARRDGEFSEEWLNRILGGELGGDLHLERLNRNRSAEEVPA